MNRRLASLCALPLVTLTACSGVSSTAPSPAPTITVTTTVTATPQIPQAAVGASGAPALGEWQSVGNIRARVVQINNKDASTYNQIPDASALVEVCVQVGSYTPWWSPWNATDGSGGFFPASSSRYDDYPKPGYPFSGAPVLTEGKCAKGWVVFETTTKGTRLSEVSYTSGAGSTMTWGAA